VEKKRDLGGEGVFFFWGGEKKKKKNKTHLSPPLSLSYNFYFELNKVKLTNFFNLKTEKR
jgi:hypothetical protein